MKAMRDVFGEIEDFHLYVLLMDSNIKGRFKNEINKEFERRNFSTDNLRLLLDRYKTFQANIDKLTAVSELELKKKKN